MSTEKRVAPGIYFFKEEGKNKKEKAQAFEDLLTMIKEAGYGESDVYRGGLMNTSEALRKMFASKVVLVKVPDVGKMSVWERHALFTILTEKEITIGESPEDKNMETHESKIERVYVRTMQDKEECFDALKKMIESMLVQMQQ